MRDDFETLHVERVDDHILVVTLDRPEVANAKNTAMGLEHKELYEGLYRDTEEVRCVVMTGRGKVFCAGGDLKERKGMTDKEWMYQHAVFEQGVLALRMCPVPVIAAVNGPAKVHAELALLCDIVLASEQAVFKDSPHFRYGTVPGDGVHLIWPLLLGMNRGRHFLLTGKQFDAGEALDLGLVAEVLPRDELNARAWEVARDLAKRPAITLRYARLAITQLLKQVLQENLSYGLALEGLGAWNNWPSE